MFLLLLCSGSKLLLFSFFVFRYSTVRWNLAMFIANFDRVFFNIRLVMDIQILHSCTGPILLCCILYFSTDARMDWAWRWWDTSRWAIIFWIAPVSCLSFTAGWRQFLLLGQLRLWVIKNLRNIELFVTIICLAQSRIMMRVLIPLTGSMMRM